MCVGACYLANRCGNRRQRLACELRCTHAAPGPARIRFRFLVLDWTGGIEERGGFDPSSRSSATSHGHQTQLCTLKLNATAQFDQDFCSVCAAATSSQHREPLNCAQSLARPSDTDDRFWVAAIIFASLSRLFKRDAWIAPRLSCGLGSRTHSRPRPTQHPARAWVRYP